MSTQQNQQVIFVQPGEVELQAKPVPAPAAHELLIRTRVSLISPGTERAFFLSLPNTTDNYPQPAGYSNIGEVVAWGEAVTGWQVGDRVASAGHHAAYISVDAAKCLPVPSELEDEDAAFFNLAAIALQGVRKARIELGEPVAVLGAGLIGLMALQLARLQGGLPVISLDQDASRLEFANEAGADATLTTLTTPMGDDLAARLQPICDDGAAVVIEATGHPAAILTALACARPFGRVILLGSTRGVTDGVNFYRDIHRKGLTVIGAHNIARPKTESHAGWWTEREDQRVTLELLARQRIRVQPFITDRFPWQQAPAAYARLQSWERSSLGMILDWTASR